MKLPKGKLRSNFIDTLRLYLKGGNGGAGHPKYGGIGGQGGSIYMEAKTGVTLKTLQSKEPSQRYSAEPGMASQQFLLVGKEGKRVVLPVPPGVVCTTDTGAVLGETNVEGECVLVASGGDGGSPTNGFIGQKGEHHHVKLVLKTIADIGLVGFPNAGKSTLLSAISRAKPKIANYPFTTVRPKVGVLQYPDLRQITMADLPGLVEGAAHNRGMGHSFLRHIERTKMLLLIVAVDGFKLSNKDPRRNAYESLLLLNKELELYDPTMLNKPAMLLVNKMDVKGAKKLYDEMMEHVAAGEEYVATMPEEMRPTQLLRLHGMTGISAKTNEQSVAHVKTGVRILLDIAADADPSSSTDLVPAHTQDAQIFDSAHKEHGAKLT